MREWDGLNEENFDAARCVLSDVAAAGSGQSAGRGRFAGSSGAGKGVDFLGFTLYPEHITLSGTTQTKTVFNLVTTVSVLTQLPDALRPI